jgi:hypothetical protein
MPPGNFCPLVLTNSSSRKSKKRGGGAGGGRTCKLPENLSISLHKATAKVFLERMQEPANGNNGSGPPRFSPNDTLLIGFNTGFGNFIDTKEYSLLWGWLEDLKYIANCGIPAAFSCANDYADLNGEVQVL